jgi:signal transduction histidine kinase
VAAEEARRRRASDERLRMAQELHDVLAHDLSLISVQAGVALHLLEEHPEQTRPALAAIREASGDALGELRRVLEILRADGDDDGAPRRPAPSLGDLEGLVARTAAAGVDARLRVTGDRRVLPGDLERAAYRIVQESLTNAARYAGGAPVEVSVDFGGDAVTVQVDDHGPGPAPGRSAGSGSGIAGMRERASALGGRLDVGPRAGGGFRVRAWLPLDTAPARSEPPT